MTTTILEEIVRSKKTQVANDRERNPIEQLFVAAEQTPRPRDFLGSLSRPGSIKLIAEVKKASPSAKVIRPDFDPVTIAQTYEHHAATCLSVLTDAPYFQGSIDNLIQIRRAVDLPILRKEFIIDEYQIVEARAAGADAILLIAEILDDRTLKQFQIQANQWGMAALVEFHDPVNLPRVLDSGAILIGINNRDLRRFTTSLEHTLSLCDQIPSNRVLVSESGISTRADVVALEAAGVSAILVGESLLRERDVGQAVDALLGRSPNRA